MAEPILTSVAEVCCAHPCLKCEGIRGNILHTTLKAQTDSGICKHSRLIIYSIEVKGLEAGRGGGALGDKTTDTCEISWLTWRLFKTGAWSDSSMACPAPPDLDGLLVSPSLPCATPDHASSVY